MTTPAPEPTPSAKPRTLAARIRKLGISGLTTPEDILIEKLALAEAIARIARDLEGPPSCR